MISNPTHGLRYRPRPGSFVSGNIPAAKSEVGRLLSEGFGWRDIIELGDITIAPGMESLLPAWIRPMMAFGHPNFQFEIAR